MRRIRPITAARTIRVKSPPTSRPIIVALFAILSLVLMPSGCTRQHYRLQADREVTQILNEKNLPGRWGLPNFRLQYDARSRYFDPTNPDHPPMPPDDRYSHVFMHYVDGMKGARNYHVDGDLKQLQNPSWRYQLASYTDMRDDGKMYLDLDGTVQLAIIHDPDYREQLEELYFSALDVSTERFRFDTQFFGGFSGVDYAHLSRNAPGAGGLTRDTLTVVPFAQAQRQFAAGGQLLVGFANTLVWQLAGPYTSSSRSLINFIFVQPLLRNGCRRFILEQLTIVERALLSNLRAFERYRQGFYTNLAVGDGGTTGAQRRGGFFGGTGLTGFTGQGSSGFGGVGDITGFGRSGTGGTGGGGAVTGGFAGGGAGTLGGYVGLLQTTQQIRNTQQNLNAQLRTLRLLQANLEAGTIDIAQVDQFRQNIETARATLLQSENNLENTFETYKRTQIGLPPDLAMELDDAMIRQFQFIDPSTNDLYERLEDFVDELGNLPIEPDLDVLTMALDRMTAYRDESARTLDAIRGDLAQFDARRPERKQRLSDAEATQFDKDYTALVEAFGELESMFQSGAAEVETLRAGLKPTTRKRTIEQLVISAKALASLIQEASLVQVRARLESVMLAPVVLDPQLALNVARANRLDWMNNRAALVDSWRLIAFNARSLLATLNVRFGGSLGTVGNNPAKFQAETGTLNAGLEFDAPFTRLIERNNYRSALIEYQRDRRQLIQFEDGVNQSLRQSLRTLKQLEVNLEIQRRAVTIAARRVDQTREVLSKPPEPAVPGQAAAGLGPTAALNLLTALNDLQASQNNFMSVWLNHYAARMILVRELGLMELDDRGIWIDRPLDELLARAELCSPEDLPPDVPQSWYEALDQLSTPTGEQLPTQESNLEAVPAPLSPLSAPLNETKPEMQLDNELTPPAIPQLPPPAAQPPHLRSQPPRLIPPTNGGSLPHGASRKESQAPRTAAKGEATGSHGASFRTASQTRIAEPTPAVSVSQPAAGTIPHPLVDGVAPAKPGAIAKELFGTPPLP
ncbi:MAG: TolC family protein [Planctomycetaceae bacterium]|nr:TolC family protein [Planctomycetaceae bacterium]